MDKKVDLSFFFSLADLFSKNGFSLYMVGGTARDYLLNLNVLDYDFATDATPNEMKEFLVDADYSFSRFGVVTYKKANIVTFRLEQDYHDFRHPRFVKFTRKMELDYIRRDLTINALYIDRNLKVYDFSNGLGDLKNKIIRFIGNPEIRVKEDPLRILRAERFAKKLGFSIEKESLKAMNDNRKLLEMLNDNKIKEEIKKNKK